MRLTTKILRERLFYSPSLGIFRWVKRCNQVKFLDIPHSLDDCGYIRFTVLGKKYRAHRLAWFYMTGKWPRREIDHKNGVRSDNRWINLREADRSLNMQNRRGPNLTNGTGFLGVSKHGTKFGASIKINGKQKFLGCFEKPSAAHDAYLGAKRKLHPGAI